jgi:polysaccharide biosynthesis/export protein
MNYSLPEQSSRGYPLGRLAIAMVAISLLSGCASRVYRASSLPAELAASPAVKLDTLNLSGLAGLASSQDVICWGDLLAIEIDAGLPSLEPRTSSVRVAKDGTAKIPLIGSVAVAGLEAEQAEAAVVEAARSRNVYLNPFVSVRVTEQRKNRVTVVGAVEKPGVYELPRGSSSLMAAIVNAEGLSDTASGEVELRHTDPRLAGGMIGPGGAAPGGNGPQLASHETAAGIATERINLLDASARGVGNHELNDGDVVNVTARELPPVHVLGLVVKPGPVEVTSKRDLYLADALSQAGGFTNPAADRVTILRRLPGETQPVIIVASIRKAMDGQDNVLLAPGDTVTVRQTPATGLVDVFRTFIRFGVGSSFAMF